LLPENSRPRALWAALRDLARRMLDEGQAKDGFRISLSPSGHRQRRRTTGISFPQLKTVAGGFSFSGRGAPNREKDARHEQAGQGQHDNRENHGRG
jgi:hypothetical protein